MNDSWSSISCSIFFVRKIHKEDNCYLLTNTELINVFTGYVQTLDLFYMPSIC